MKVVKINSENRLDINNDLKILQQLANQNPLNLRGYEGCAIDHESKTVFIFMEYFDFSLGEEKFQSHVFKNYPLDQVVGLFLLMANDVALLKNIDLNHMVARTALLAMLIAEPPQ